MPETKGRFGFNGTISARGYGTRRIRVTKLDFGLGIIASSDNEARNRRAFYPIVTTGSSFTMTLGFISWEERERFHEWMNTFMADLSSGRAKYGTQTIRCPARKFTRVAVPESEIEYGEGVTDVGYESAIGFCGASDPVDINLGSRQAGASYFKGPRKSEESRFFYPLGRQVAGAESLEGAIFDPDPVGTESAIPLDDPSERFFHGEVPF